MRPQPVQASSETRSPGDHTWRERKLPALVVERVKRNLMSPGYDRLCRQAYVIRSVYQV
jgi:hypothetical protein